MPATTPGATSTPPVRPTPPAASPASGAAASSCVPLPLLYLAHFASLIRAQDSDVDDYLRAVAADTFTPALEQPAITGASAPLYMRLREHHCISPAAPLPAEEDVMNAFFARDFPDARLWAVSEREGRLNIGRRGRAEEWVYETYAEGRRGGHDEETCGMCAERRRVEEERRAAARERRMDVELEGCRCEGDSGCECGECGASFDDDPVRRTRQAVQDALGRGTDLEQFIEHVAREEPVPDLDVDTDGEGDTEADDASLYSYSAALSDSDGSTASDMAAMFDIPETKPVRACDGILDIIVTGEVRSPFVYVNSSVPR